MSDKYILRGHDVVPEPDLLTWAQWYETAERRVAQNRVGDFEISTIFLGLDMELRNSIDPGSLPPLLFETIVFKGPNRRGGIQCMERCTTWDEAVAQHHALKRQFARSVNN